ncbi:MAG: recombination protein NinG [Pseudomonadota bacterium]
MTPTKPQKQRKCKVCPSTFTPMRPFQTWCSVPCGSVLAEERLAKKKKADAIADRKATKQALEKHKRRGDLLAETQTAFNKFIRLRDAGQTCICCGKPFEPQRPGGSVDAGHYLSRGSAPHLRFDERNVHAQRKNCNRPGGTTREAFRAGMIQRIGLEAVEALECDQSLKKYTDDDLRAIKTTYTAKARELEKERA